MFVSRAFLSGLGMQGPFSLNFTPTASEEDSNTLVIHT